MKKDQTNYDNTMTMILLTLIVVAFVLVATSCGTVKGGGCGGSPIHLGN